MTIIAQHMYKLKQLFVLVLSIMALLCCSQQEKYLEGTFGYDVELLKTALEPIILEAGNSKIAVLGKNQGRVITSTAQGMNGKSYGWFNRKLLLEGLPNSNNNLINGESRIMFGPEIGKYALFFKPGTPQTVKYMVHPPDLNSVKFIQRSKTERSVSYGGELSLLNSNNYVFKFDMQRDITIYTKQEIEENLGIVLNDQLLHVGFEAKTTIKNTGTEQWKKETGLLSIWDLGCLPPSHNTIVVIPTRNGIDTATIYFTPVGNDRLKTINDVVYYRGDGDYLNKIGIPPKYTKPVFGSYNIDEGILTIAQFKFDGDTTYVNSHWVNQDDPYAGDVINVFNDGVHNGEGPFGPFYELESSSCSKELNPGEKQMHYQRIYHIEGDKEELDKIAKKVLGVGLAQIETALD